MKMLEYLPNPNNARVAELIRTTRKALFNSAQDKKWRYTIRGVAEAVGISPTYYGELENNENEVVKLKVIYGICKHFSPFCSLYGHLQLKEKAALRQPFISV